MIERGKERKQIDDMQGLSSQIERRERMSGRDLFIFFVILFY